MRANTVGRNDKGSRASKEETKRRKKIKISTVQG